MQQQETGNMAQGAHREQGAVDEEYRKQSAGYRVWGGDVWCIKEGSRGARCINQGMGSRVCDFRIVECRLQCTTCRVYGEQSIGWNL